MSNRKPSGKPSAKSVLDILREQGIPKCCLGIPDCDGSHYAPTEHHAGAACCLARLAATEVDHVDLLRRYIHHVRGYNGRDLLSPDDNNAFRGRRWFTEAEVAELKRLAALPENTPIEPTHD